MPRPEQEHQPCGEHRTRQQRAKRHLDSKGGWYSEPAVRGGVPSTLSSPEPWELPYEGPAGGGGAVMDRSRPGSTTRSSAR
ncbi:protein of unknown function [Streptomyces murinus]